MKRTISMLGMLGAVAGAIAPGLAMAQVACPTSPYTVAKSTSDIETVVGGNMACYPVAGPPWTNQEWHSSASASGTITDYKLGTGTSRDPSKQIGTYSIQSNEIEYLYYISGTTTPGGSTFTYTVWGTSASDAAGTYQFCNVSGTPATPLMVSIVSGGPRSCTVTPP